MQTVTLNNGVVMPQLGFGVWQVPDDEAQPAVETAIAAGYRSIDTAKLYHNEEGVGRAVRASGVARSELFITTKLWNDDHGYDAALRALDGSLGRLGMDHVDLYLVHWPVQGKRRDSWRALEKAFADGKAKAIGISNYLVPHLREVLGDAKVRPHVNQIELSPFLQRRDAVAMCKEHGIVIEAYSPLTRGKRLDDPVVGEIARAVHRTPAQVLLRWGIQHGFVVLPKSVTRSRIAENGALFDFALDAAQMARLDGLEEGLKMNWDPEGAP